MFIAEVLTIPSSHLYIYIQVKISGIDWKRNQPKKKNNYHGMQVLAFVNKCFATKKRFTQSEAETSFVVEAVLHTHIKEEQEQQEQERRKKKEKRKKQQQHIYIFKLHLVDQPFIFKCKSIYFSYFSYLSYLSYQLVFFFFLILFLASTCFYI